MKRVALALLLAGCAATQKPRFQPNADGSPPAPFILDPKPGAVIVDVRPPISVELAPGLTRTRFEICRDKKCTDVVTTFEATGTRALSPIDLESGAYWLRASAGTADHFGGLTPSQKLGIELRSKIATPHFVLDGPREGEATLVRLGTLSEKLLAFYLAYLGLDDPQRTLALSFYATEDGYHVITSALGAQKLANHGGFTRATHSYMRWTPRLARSVVEGPGTLERVLAHELVHQVQALRPWRFVQGLPPWLREASADLLAEEALASIYALPVERLATFFGRHGAAKRALRDSYLIPLPIFVDAGSDLWKADERKTVTLFYSEGYALLRSLASPPERMHNFLREIWTYDGDVGASVRRKLRASFGDPPTLGKQLETWLGASLSAPFSVLNGELRLLTNGDLHLEAARGAYAQATRAPEAETTRVELDAEPSDDFRFFQVQFGADQTTTYAARVWKNGYIQLLHNGSTSTLLAQAKLGTAVHGKCALVVTFGAGSATVSLGGTQVSAAVPLSLAGPTGFGVSDGSLLVHDMRVITAPTP